MPIIDIHTHGIGGYDTKRATPEDILRIAEIHGSYGVSAIIPTIYSAPVQQMRADIEVVRKAMELQAAEKSSSKFKACPQVQWLGVQSSRLKNDSPADKSVSDKTNTKNLEPRTLNIEQCSRGNTPSATILGVHLEGPFLNRACAGALDGNTFLPAKISMCRQLLEGFSDIVKIITLAPELDGAPDLIRSIADTGVIVSMGHSDATYGEAEAGFNAGAKGITHIFNAMRGIHHREPGIVGFGLINPHVYVEIIADPFHLHPKTIELIFAMKKPEKIIIVSDSVKAAQMGATTRSIKDSAGKLLGGSMTITASAKYLIGLGFEKVIVAQCIGANPVKYLTNELKSVSLS
jgi:N-acetylglucosamine-6-phosphate deacetylase